MTNGTYLWSFVIR